MAYSACRVDVKRQVVHNQHAQTDTSAPVAVPLRALREHPQGCRWEPATAWLTWAAPAAVHHACSHSLTWLAGMTVWRARWAPGSCGSSLGSRPCLPQSFRRSHPASRMTRKSCSGLQYLLPSTLIGCSTPCSARTLRVLTAVVAK